MKKLLAVLLAIICAFSAFSVSALDIAGTLGDILGDQLGVESEEDEGDFISNGITYQMSLLSTETIIYTPTMSITFEVPTDMVIPNDTPIAVDHNWIAWRDQDTGKLYYPGDTIHVEGKVVLIAVWEEKTDNYPGFIRSIIAGVQALIRMVEKALSTLNGITTAPAETTTAAAAA